LVEITNYTSPNYTDDLQVNIHCIENFFTVHDFWATCACPEKIELPWNFSLYWIYFLHLGFLTTCACPENSFPWKFLLYWIYFLLFRIFEQLALALKNRVCPEIFPLYGTYFSHSEFWASCACAWKTELHWNFSSVLNMYFLSFRIFEQLVLALKKTQLPWKFSLHTFRSFEQLALALKGRVSLEFFTLLKYFISFKIFEQLALALKNRGCPKFTVLNMYFLFSGVLSNLRLPWKTEFALKIFKPGGAAPPRPPASYAYDHGNTSVKKALLWKSADSLLWKLS